MSGATIKNTEQLTHLHLDVMSSLHPYLTHSDVQTHMFTSPPVVADVSTTWVQHYFDEQGPESFHPHITLGEGKVRQPERPVTFTAARLALCHLGSYCTCRKILTEHILA
jgi:hypothetical protein